MAEPVSAVGMATTAVSVADKLHSWHESAQAAKMTQQQKDAAALVYNAAVLASAVASLDLEFRTLRDKINKLDPGWSQDQRNKLAKKVHALATKESRLKQLKQATGFLRDRTQPEKKGWRDKILHRGGRDQKLDEALKGLVEDGDKVLVMIGANVEAPTPYEIAELEPLIAAANDVTTVQEAKAKAENVLGVIDHLTARGVPEAFGRFASVLSKKHGITAPDWATVK